ncbi:MAG: hypothetical protein AAGG46_00190 [Planctomycetota bacterium]
MLEPYYQSAMDWLSAVQSSTWAWFANLSREEWLIVLAAVTAAGFLCMRGFGSRSQY